ncbi:hypothetical protein AUC43_09105 [Hymenobacter sedentarius]|uniref:histidine kinase n=1 Tax=Hymenobacter sedentarius TaxID=1411621 RepID=A0A0U4BP97_9BACT|nr:ATP-binding protein [Hymenobacter sedentarius]ALW85239.1 hypothetical protein AUC43_09105 [Hymenobacter sedentarius]
MRFVFLLVAVWLLALPARAMPVAPDTTVLRVTRLPAAGLLLTQGWRYHPGDNPAWARPEFDDSAWDTLNPTRPRRELPPRLGSGIGWLRLRFRFSDSLRRRELQLVTSQLGAVEIYLNGQLLRRRGTLSTNPALVRAAGNTHTPVALPGSGLTEQVLALRLAPQPLSPLLTTGQVPLLRPRLYTVPHYHQLEAQSANFRLLYFGLGSAYVLLTLLHLVFSYYNPTQRTNRYFARYTLTGAAAGFFTCLDNAEDFASLGTGVWVRSLVFVCSFASLCWLVRSVYALFDFRPGRIYGSLLLSGAALLLLVQLAHSAVPGYVVAYLALGALGYVEMLRLTLLALRQRRRGARLVGAGFGGALLLVLLNLGLNVLGITLGPAWLVGNVLIILASLLPALAISLFLAREFALGAELLLVKLGEVERLSAQTLAQEQDKQALLARQNETLEHQVQQRTSELQRSLTDLQTTQAQLIQKEKLASLGELTAGIAHEIQNPLNFVNNFSEVSTELVVELQEALAKSDTVEAAELAGDVAQNLGKITEHGKRAAAIVKGMLEHSRTSTGERAPTDLNALADEYLRLAYHGLRAKDKSFNAELRTDLAPDLPLISVVSGDVGRVLLNLFSNAFYAVQQRQQAGEAGYRPTVSLTTARVNGHVAIRVRDNGTGMSAAVQAKIFQPFFTTKPTGEGTGLGLSLSHDIIAQGHGGGLTVESLEGEGTTFSVSLPLNGAAHQPAT